MAAHSEQSTPDFSNAKPHTWR